MAYDFTSASSQYLSTATAPVTAAPLTLACWFFAKDTAVTSSLMFLGPRTGTIDRRFNLFSAGSVAGAPVRYLVSQNPATVSTVSIDTTSGYTAGTWTHACAVSSSSSSHSVYLNAGSRGSSSLNVVPPDINTLAIGGRYLGSFGGYANARIAEVGVWAAALQESEIRSLAAGVSPALVRPQSLVFYAPLTRNIGDMARGIALTNNNTATVADHPRIYI